MKSGSLCALLWRILSWCTRKQVTLKACHIPGWLNVIADKLSRLGQTIPTEWSLHPEVFQAICSRWHQPKVDLFATRFNNKLPQFVSPVPDPQAWAVDALSLSWENLDPYAFPPAAILGKVVEKLQDYPCNRIILIARGSTRSVYEANGPFLQSGASVIRWSNLDPYAFPPAAILGKVVQKLQDYPCNRIILIARGSTRSVYEANGPFLESGASVIRCTSGHHL